MRFCNSHPLAFVSDLTAAIYNCRNEERRKLTCFILHLLVLSLMFLPKANKKQIHGLLFAQLRHWFERGNGSNEIEWKAFVEMGRRAMI